MPATPPGVLPGTHRIQVDKNDIVWASENWAHNLVRLDPATGQFTITPLIAGDEPLNTPGLGNFSIGPDLGVWFARNKAVQKFDSKTGKLLERVPFTATNNANPYDNIVTDDGNFWAGGAAAGGGDTIEMMDAHQQAPGGAQLLAQLDGRQGRLRPGRQSLVRRPRRRAARARRQGGANPRVLAADPYVTFYEAMPDKRGEVWAGELHGGRMLRFNPQADHWTEYVLPEPYSHDRRTWIDNSTTPVTVWYVDHNSYLVRVQARE